MRNGLIDATCYQMRVLAGILAASAIFLALPARASDCNTNGVEDGDDITGGASQDCNTDGIPDECDSVDCNANDVPDICEILFDDAVSFDAGDTPRSITLVDLDADGDLDAAVVNEGPRDVTILLNDGDAMFAAPVSYDTAQRPWSITHADLDDDGDPDLVVTRDGSTAVAVFPNNGDGTFASLLAFSAGSGGAIVRSAVATDLDGDGDIDVAVTRDGPDTVAVLINTTSGGTISFASAVQYSAGNHPQSVTAADFDDDGSPDLATANNTDDEVSVLLNNGDGTFGAQSAIAVGNRPVAIASGDLNGDGAADLATANETDDSVSILIGDGTGDFAAADDYAVAGDPAALTIADLDDDGDLDLSVASDETGDDNVSILANNGDGTFATALILLADSHLLGVASDDLDGDDDADLAVVSRSSDNLLVFRNRHTTPPDCNTNCVADEEDVATGDSPDCNTNDVPDECEGLDCNGNGVPDDCDLAGGTGDDCQPNGIPDDCEPDCNTSGAADDCDISSGTSDDCNSNGIPDDCEADCDSDGLIDVCEAAPDCNSNGVPDECEADCNTNDFADECDVAQGAEDCNTNGVPDECELGDCDQFWSNGAPDGVNGLANQIGGVAPAETADDFDAGLDMTAITLMTFSDVEDTTYDWNETVLVSTWTDDGGGGPSETAYDAMLIPTEGGSVERVMNGAMFGRPRWDYVIEAPVLVSSGETNWVSATPGSDGTSGQAFWLTSRVPASFGNSYFRSAFFGFSTWTSTADVIGENWDFAFTIGVCRDCNDSGRLDECDIAGGTSPDCNVNGVPDECELANGDCDSNGIPDDCGQDCNTNGLADACDILGGTSADCNTNGVLDDCDIVRFVPSAYSTTWIANQLVSGDFDGDGDPDLAVSGDLSGYVMILVNLGPSEAPAEVDYFLDGTLQGIAAADLDGDGDLDLAVTHYEYVEGTGFVDASVRVLINAGDGTFSPAAIDFPVGDVPYAIAVADLDADDDADIATANVLADSVSVLLNAGDGTFAAAVDYAVGDIPTDVAASDLDGDGDADLVVANRGGSEVSVLANDGAGTFLPAVDYTCGDGPFSATPADMDADGDIDLATVNYDADSVSVLLNSGGGMFGAPDTYDPGLTNPFDIAAGDLDGDGDEDLVITDNAFGDNVAFLRNNGDGTFAIANPVGAGGAPYDVTIIDFDGDSRLDVAVTSTATIDVVVLLNEAWPGSPDCNTNGVPDECDVAAATAPDCNTNGVPDDCEVSTADCNTNDVPDECDIDADDPDGNGSVSIDCNSNGTPDECDGDCNTNGVADECDVISAGSDDCNSNGVPDECDPDCNTNDVPDACEALPDCNSDSVPDECQAEPDCDCDGVGDVIEIECEGAPDVNTNGIPDGECDEFPPGVDPFPVSFSVAGPVDPQTDGIAAPPGMPWGNYTRTPSISAAYGVSTFRPGDVNDYFVMPLPSEAEFFQSEPDEPVAGLPVGTNNQILVADALGLVADSPAGSAHDDIDALSFGEDFFGVTDVTSESASEAIPWDARLPYPLEDFPIPVVLVDVGTSFRLSWDPWAIGLPGTMLEAESGGCDDGSGTGDWESPGGCPLDACPDGAAGDVFSTPILATPPFGPGIDFLDHDELALGLRSPAVDMEDDLDALECIGFNTKPWFFGPALESGNLHSRVLDVAPPPLAPPAVQNHVVDAFPTGDPFIGSEGFAPVFFSVTRNSTGRWDSAVRSQFVAGSALLAAPPAAEEQPADVFMNITYTDPASGLLVGTNLLFIDNSQLGLMGQDNMDALIMTVYVGFRAMVADLAAAALAFRVVYNGDGTIDEDGMPDDFYDHYRGFGYTESLTMDFAPFFPIQVGFSVSSDSIGLAYTAVDYESRGLGAANAGVMQQCGDIYYSLCDPFINMNWMWYEETAIAGEPGSWDWDWGAGTPDLSRLPDELNGLDSIGEMTDCIYVPGGTSNEGLVGTFGPATWAQSTGTTIGITFTEGAITLPGEQEYDSEYAPAPPNDCIWSAQFAGAGLNVEIQVHLYNFQHGQPLTVPILTLGDPAVPQPLKLQVDVGANSYTLQDGNGQLLCQGPWSQYPNDCAIIGPPIIGCRQLNVPLPTNATLGDMNGDGLIDGDDVSGFVLCLEGGDPNAPGCGQADMNGDGILDDADTAIFVTTLLGNGE